MKFAILAALCASVSAAPFVARQNTPTADQIAQLAPDLGGFPNTNPNSGGDCDGPPQADGKIPRVPCACPPLRDAYIKAMTTNVLAGHAVNNTVVNISFPVGDSVQDKHGRITAAIITLQNLNGPGRGCPGVSTTLGTQSKNLDKCGDFFCNGDAPAVASSSAPAPAPETTTSAPAVPPQAAPTQVAVGNNGGASTVTVTLHTVVTSIVTVTAGGDAPTSTPAAADSTSTEAVATSTSTAAAVAETTSAAADTGNGVISRELLDQLAPQLGSQPNNNPNQFGDCDGPVQPNGNIPRVPCACPPTRDVFLDQLQANLAVGHAVRNPSVKISFPTGNSKADQHARITAGTITLQNLNGPGQGCPNVSTTFAAQSNAIGN